MAGSDWSNYISSFCSDNTEKVKEYIFEVDGLSKRLSAIKVDIREYIKKETDKDLKDDLKEIREGFQILYEDVSNLKSAHKDVLTDLRDFKTWMKENQNLDKEYAAQEMQRIQNEINENKASIADIHKQIEEDILQLDIWKNPKHSMGEALSGFFWLIVICVAIWLFFF